MPEVVNRKVRSIRPASAISQAFFFIRKVTVVLFSISCVVVVLSGCSSNSTVESTGKNSLVEAVNSYWTAVVNGNWNRAYDYEYPPFRETVPREVYVSRKGNPLVRIRSYRVEGIKFEEERKEALVSLRLALSLFVPGSRDTGKISLNVRDKWVRIGNRWYHVPRKLDVRGAKR